MHLSDVLKGIEKDLISKLEITRFFNSRGFKELRVDAYFWVATSPQAQPESYAFEVKDSAFDYLATAAKRLEELGLEFEFTDLTAFPAKKDLPGGQSKPKGKPSYTCGICGKSGKVSFRKPVGCANPHISPDGWLCNLASQNSQPHLVNEVTL